MNIVTKIYDKMELYYIVSKQSVVSYYNYYLATFVGFQELKISNNNAIFSVFIRYIIYLFLTKLILLMKYIRSFTDITTSHLHVIKLHPNNKNAMILHKDVIKFKHLTQLLTTVEDDDKMLNVVLLKFDLVDNDNTTCLKNLVVKYKDTYTTHHNTLKNILLFNSITPPQDATIQIKMMRDKKMINISKPITDIHDHHINHILYFL